MTDVRPPEPALAEPTEAPRVLVVDDEAVVLDVLKDVLEYEGFYVQTASEGRAALRELANAPYDVMLTDMKMPGIDGLELMREVQSSGIPMKTIMMTGFGTVETAVEAMRKGAFDYILKPFKPEEVVRLLRRALDKHRLERENLALREVVGSFELSEALSSAMPLDAQLQLIANMVRDNLDAEGVAIVTEDPRTPGVYVTRVVSGPVDIGPNCKRLMEHFRGSPQGADRLVAHSGEANEWLLQTGASRAQSCMVAPLKVHGRMVGFLSAYSTRPRHRFSEGQRKGLSVFAGRAASAIETARMYADLRSSFTETIEGLARALEAKDPYTAGHSDRVATYARVIARSMKLPEGEIDRVYHGGLVHDIGKIGINLAVLNKAQKLSESEYEMFKSHTTMGKRIVQPISFLNHLIPFIYSHHEAWNGRGYPEGLGDTDIPFDGRLMAVADSYDAMTSNRPYRKALPHDIAVTELQRCSGQQFDKNCVRAFLEAIDTFRREQEEQGAAIPD